MKKRIFLSLSVALLPFFLYLIAATSAIGCAGDFDSQYEDSIAQEDYVTAKNLMKQQVKEYSHRDYNPTLPIRLAQSLYRLAYAYGKLGEYDSMKVATISGVNQDLRIAQQYQKMVVFFATEEYNKAATAYNGGDYEGSLRGLRTSLSMLGSDKPYEETAIAILRAMASAAAATGDMEESKESCRRGLALGDSAAVEMLKEFQTGKTPTPLPRLEPRENPPIKIL